MKEWSNCEFAGIVDEYVHSELHRRILKDKFINGYSFEKVAELNDRSVRQTKNIVYRYGDRLFLLLKEKGEG